MNIKHLCLLLMAAILMGCDDTTEGIGSSVIPTGDIIEVGAATYEVSTKSILADSVFARNSAGYLGKFTDKEFGEFKADLVTQFACMDNFTFPEHIDKISGLKLKLFYSTFFGDSVSPMRLQIDTLDTVIPEGELSTFYTSLHPEHYYDATVDPVAVKTIAATGKTVNDTLYSYQTTSIDYTQAYINSMLYASLYSGMFGGYSSFYNPSMFYDTSSATTTTTTYVKYYWQTVQLPDKLAQHMYDKYVENKNNYSDSDEFIRNVLKGLYIHCTNGDGTIIYVEDMQLVINFDYYTEGKSGALDSLVVDAATTFAASKEVIQANRFQNSGKLQELVDDESCTYLKTPSGIFTEVTLPIDQIAEEHESDTLNAASITFTRYNEVTDRKYAMSIPATLLMVRKKDMYNFFENNKLYDNIESFVANFSASSEKANTYTFNNIAPLITRCINERKSGKIEPDWDKVVLIPVLLNANNSASSSSNSNITSVDNDLRMGCSRLVGGKDKIKLKVLYSKL